MRPADRRRREVPAFLKCLAFVVAAIAVGGAASWLGYELWGVR